MSSDQGGSVSFFLNMQNVIRIFFHENKDYMAKDYLNQWEDKNMLFKNCNRCDADMSISHLLHISPF